MAGRRSRTAGKVSRAAKSPPGSEPVAKRKRSDEPPEPATRRVRRGAKTTATTTTTRPARRLPKATPPPPPPPPPVAAAARPSLNTPPADVLAVLVCGNGDSGELGLGPGIQEAARPRLNPFLDAHHPKTGFPVVQLACGGMHTVALTRGNQIVTWGVNDNGALGRSTAWDGGLRDLRDDEENEEKEDNHDVSEEDEGELNPRESTPTALPASSFPAGTVFVQVAAGDSCSLALTAQGHVYGWGTFKNPEGKDRFGLDDQGRLVPAQNAPARLPGLAAIVQIACGANHALALDAAGTVWSWGAGEQNQLGRRLVARRTRRGGEAAPPLAASLVPQPIHIRDVRYIASGEFHSFAVDRRDRVWGWGLNSFGEAGGDPRTAGRDGADLVLPHPTPIPGLARQGVAVLAGGAHHSAAVTRDGQCLAWGRLDGGQLGIAFTDAQRRDTALVRYDERGQPRICLRPTRVAWGKGHPKAAHVACGTDHTIVVDRAGTAYGAGFNAQGQLGLGHDDDVVGALQAIRGKQAQKRRIVWAGAGGQYSMLASLAEEAPKE